MNRSTPIIAQTESGLDPKDWAQTRELAHLALDRVLDYQEGIAQKPVWRPIPERVDTFLQGEAPLQGLGSEQVVAEIFEHVLAYPAGHAHPRFWGWVCGTGTPIGMMADMMAAGVNASAGTFNDAPSRVEFQVIRWMRDLFHFPETASGIITSGASVANLIGLAVGRDAKLGEKVRRGGLHQVSGTPRVYASAQVHGSVDKAMMMLGLGLENLRKIEVDDAMRIRIDALAAAIEEDRKAGYSPIAVVGNAGTVNHGAIDDLPNLAQLCKEQGLWFHIDGAVGALAYMSEEVRPLLQGLERADSLAFDFHKWLYVPYEAGCILIRDGKAHRRAFSVAAGYLESPPRGVGAMPDSSNNRGPQLSRGFKALKVWAQIREYGMETLGRVQTQNVAQIRYLAERIEAEPRLRQMGPSPLNIICFRYLPESPEPTLSDQINREILMRLQEQGIAVPSSTRVDGYFCLRVANTNHRSRRGDFDALVTAVAAIGEQVERDTAN